MQRSQLIEHLSESSFEMYFILTYHCSLLQLAISNYSVMSLANVEKRLTKKLMLKSYNLLSKSKIGISLRGRKINAFARIKSGNISAKLLLLFSVLKASVLGKSLS